MAPRRKLRTSHHCHRLGEPPCQRSAREVGPGAGAPAERPLPGWAGPAGLAQAVLWRGESAPPRGIGLGRCSRWAFLIFSIYFYYLYLLFYLYFPCLHIVPAK
jgi:hypothetical protein